KVGDGKTMLEFRKDQIVFAQGDAADTVFYLQKGRVKVVVISEQGKEAVVGILEPGQFFGEGCMNGHSVRIATTTAMEDCLVTAITKGAMLAALHDQPKFSELFMAYLLTRNSRIEEDLIDQLFNSSEKRLARLLLLLAHFGKEGSPKPIDIDVSQETLAEMIGTTRSRVSFRNRCRLVQIIDAVFDQNPKECCRNALAHGPAFERRLRRKTFRVALGNEPAFPRHNERSGQSFGGLERGIHGSFEFLGVDLCRQRLLWQHVAHGPQLGRGIGQSALDGDRLELHGALADRERDATLAPEILG